MELRDYQQDGVDAIGRAQGNVLFVLPTGGGKTAIVSHIVKNHPGHSCVIAHRQEIVAQISLSLARFGVKHNIIAQQSIIKLIVRKHHDTLGKSFYNPGVVTCVGMVDTVAKCTDAWVHQISQWIVDEAHHLLRDNTWGKAVSIFPSTANGLGVTATPCRLDGQGLGRHADGLFDSIVQGPSLRWLIDNGYLCDYRVFAPPCTIDMSNVNVTKSGEFDKKNLSTAMKKSQIVGDIVEHYRRFGAGKLTIIFVLDLNTADRLVGEFGPCAATISGKTPIAQRTKTLRQFEEREISILINVDIVGEGFDLPAVEAVIFARPSMSVGLYMQQFGRVLRTTQGKTLTVVIDAVGNVGRHGLPDSPRKWTLDRRGKRASNRPVDLIPTRSCPQCTVTYERIYSVCPYCGHEPVPSIRSGPEHVDGDLVELDAATLSQMRGDVARIDEPVRELRQRMISAGAPHKAVGGAAKNHRLRQEAQSQLRGTMALWGGKERDKGRTRSEAHRLFFFKFGTDVMSAQTLGKREAYELCSKIACDLLDL